MPSYAVRATPGEKPLRVAVKQGILTMLLATIASVLVAMRACRMEEETGKAGTAASTVGAFAASSTVAGLFGLVVTLFVSRKRARGGR